MMAQQGIVKGDALQRIGSAGFILGAILIVIGNILLPRAVDARNVQEMVTAMGQRQFLTQISALLIMIGIWAVMTGAAGIYRSITTGGAAWARLGFYFVVVGTALWIVNLALDMASASAVANWLAAPATGRDAAYDVVSALSAFGLGVFSMNITVYWMAFAFLGVGMVRSAAYPRWLSWAGLILNAPVASLGIIQIVTGRLNTLNLIFMVLSLLSALWILATGIWVARKAW